MSADAICAVLLNCNVDKNFGAKIQILVIGINRAALVPANCAPLNIGKLGSTRFWQLSKSKR
jgi:hypothetical protein